MTAVPNGRQKPIGSLEIHWEDQILRRGKGTVAAAHLGAGERLSRSPRDVGSGDCGAELYPSL